MKPAKTSQMTSITTPQTVEVRPGVVTIRNGTWTVESEKGHRTFHIETMPDDSSFAPGRRVLSLLTGPDNSNDFTNFGFVNDDGIVVWTKYRLDAQRTVLGGKLTPHEYYARVLWNLLMQGPNGVFGRKGYTLRGAGSCIRCSRKLTTPDSLDRGMGPICASKD